MLTKKMNLILGIVVLLLPAFSCDKPTDSKLVVQEIRDMEADFARMAADSGIAQAFRYFAAPNAELMRGPRIIAGRDSIFAYNLRTFGVGDSLVWAPDTVVVSRSGELAVSRGAATLFRRQSDGSFRSSGGHFRTVWQKQPDGTWRYLMD